MLQPVNLELFKGSPKEASRCPCSRSARITVAGISGDLAKKGLGFRAYRELMSDLALGLVLEHMVSGPKY